MEGVKSFWVVNKVYSDVREFHFSSDIASFVVFVKGENIAFVLDNTCDIVSPNNLLIIEPLPEDVGVKDPKTKWDSILKNKYSINPINIRPKENTKYKKLDISYTNLDLYRDFLQNQTDDLLSAIMRQREDLSLENAYDREAENLLEYNKSTQTIEKALITLENLKQKVLNVSKRLRKQSELEETNSDKADAALKAELTQKLYNHTEKLKRTERRIKRAKKRSEAAFADLSLKRTQIQEIKNRIAKRSGVQQDNPVSFFDYPYSQPTFRDSMYSEPIPFFDYPYSQPTFRDSMYSEPIPFFDYPYSQPTFRDSMYSEPIPFFDYPYSQPKFRDDEYIITEEIPEFYIDKNERLTSENINANNTNREDSLKEKNMVKDINTRKDTDFIPPSDNGVSTENSNLRFATKTSFSNDRYKKIFLYSASVILSIILIFGIFVLLSDNNSEFDDVNSNYVEQNYTDVVENDTPVIEPVVEETTIVEEESVPVVEEAPVVEEVVEKKETPVVKPAPVVVKKTQPKKEASVVKMSNLDVLRREYVTNVIAGDAYVELLNKLKSDFFTLDDESLISSLEEMNHYWNSFRNAVYDEYYENDYTLKSGIDYESYDRDEYLLRLYSNAYQDFYTSVVNEFAMTYEYAAGSATDLYSEIEDSLDVLGRPVAKLELLSKLYAAIQDEGGVDAVLEKIANKDDDNEISDSELKDIEIELIPLVQTTSVTYEEPVVNAEDTDVDYIETTSITENIIPAILDEEVVEVADVEEEEPIEVIETEEKEEIADVKSKTSEESVMDVVEDVEEEIVPTTAEIVSVETEEIPSISQTETEKATSPFEVVIEENDSEMDFETDESEYADEDEDYFDDEDDEASEYSEADVELEESI